jgi:hypothetical protein
MAKVDPRVRRARTILVAAVVTPVIIVSVSALAIVFVLVFRVGA